jgi:hypothetical protein
MECYENGYLCKCPAELVERFDPSVGEYLKYEIQHSQDCPAPEKIKELLNAKD